MSDELERIKKLANSSLYGKYEAVTIETLPFTVTQYLPVTGTSEIIAKVATHTLALELAFNLSEAHASIKYRVTGMGLNTTIINGEIK